MSLATSITLSVGDPPATDSLNLTDNTNFSIPTGQLSFGGGQSLQGGINWGSHVIPVQQTQASPQPPNTRVIGIPLFVRSDYVSPGTGDDRQAQMDWLSENRRAIDKKLDQARQAWGAYGIGTKVSLEFWPAGHSNPAIFDVAGGVLNVIDVGLLDFTPMQVCMLVLYVSPYTRGPAVTTTVSATLTNGISAPYYVAGVAGDHDPITRVIVRGIGGVIIQKLRLGLRAARPMAVSDFTPTYSAAISTATGNIGTLTAVAGTRSGNAVRCTPQGTFKPFAQVVGAGGPLDYGVFDVYAKINDHSTALQAPSNLQVTGVTAAGVFGTQPATFAVTAVDGAGNETAASAQVIYSIPVGSGFNAYSLSWTDVGAPASHKVYLNYPTQGWQTYTVGAGTSVTISALASVHNQPPATSAAAFYPGQLQAFAMVNGSNQNLSSVAGRTAVSQVANGLWEFPWLGTLRLPPMVHQEASAELNWRLQFQVANTGSTAAYDLDYVTLFPHDYAGSFTEVTAPNGALTQQCDWVIDSRHDGRASAKLLASSDHVTLVGQADIPNGFTIRPGDNLIVIEAETFSGNAFQPLTSLQYTVQVVYEPRYNFDRGSS